MAMTTRTAIPSVKLNDGVEIPVVSKPSTLRLLSSPLSSLLALETELYPHGTAHRLT